MRSVVAPLLLISAAQPAWAGGNSFDARSISTASRLLDAQNAERETLGLPRLEWDPALEQAAAAYAQELATTGRWRHSPATSRVGQGENLWVGTRNAYSAEEMIASWVSEKKFFRTGMFPDVSNTGNWQDVGHYTQIIWSETHSVGCSVRSSAQLDYLVCRYSTPGNVKGRHVIHGHSEASRAQREGSSESLGA